MNAEDGVAIKVRRAAITVLAKVYPSRFPACLMYHSIGDFSPSFCVDKTWFMDHLQFLKATRRILSPHEFLLKEIFDKDEVMLTFDDGYLDNYEIVANQAEALNIPVTLFITINLMGKSFFRGDIPLMDSVQVKEIAKWKNVTVGSHSLSHPKLKMVSHATQRSEIEDSKKALEDLIGREVNSFCYPHGSYGPETVKMVKEAGYITAFTTRIGAMTRLSPLEVERVPVNRFSQHMLPTILTKGYLKYARLSNFFA